MTSSLHRTNYWLRRAIADELLATPGLDSSHMRVAVKEGVVLLSGEAASQRQVLCAVGVAGQIPGVMGVGSTMTLIPA